jgi:hypothetical protein
MSQSEKSVARYCDSDSTSLVRLLGRFGLSIEERPEGGPIPGSFWGDEEAGLQGTTLLVRPDTPIHSILHESCHFICLDDSRRQALDTDAGGDYDEENAVCYLQILLAGELDGYDSHRMMRDMDTWGYSFRLGSARAWFESDAEDAESWLRRHGLITQTGKPTFRIRKDSLEGQ